MRSSNAPYRALATLAVLAALAADVPLRELCDRFADVEVTEPLRVGLMTDSGSLNDGTFNQYAYQYAYEGMQAAACFGLETTYVASGDDATVEIPATPSGSLAVASTQSHPA